MYMFTYVWMDTFYVLHAWMLSITDEILTADTAHILTETTEAS